MATNLQQLLDYYADKLIAQYRLMPKARATIEIFGKQLVADDLATALGLAFSINTAVGAQLDILGKYIGINRRIGDVLPDTQEYFGFELYAGGGNENGFADYTDLFINLGPIFYRYQYAIGIPSAVDDETYRMVLKFQIVANSSDGTLYSLQRAIADFFGGSMTITDPKDMTLVYGMDDVPPISISIIRRFLPRPLTLGTSFVVVSPVQRCLDDGTPRKIDQGPLRALIAG